MKELKDIVEAHKQATAHGKQTALATVVHVEGSSYRRPGARMLVTEDGQITGAISGGCLEGDALRKAQLTIIQQQNRLVVYDTNDEDDAKFGVQLGCNGIVSILFEPIKTEDANNPIRLLEKVVSQRTDSMLVTTFGHDANVSQTGTIGYIAAHESLWLLNDERLKTEAELLLQARSSSIKQYADVSALFQVVVAPVQLVIAGAGNDAKPLVQMASLLGWTVIVVDGRHTHAQRQRFPLADQTIISKADEALLQIQTDAQTAFVLMTHNYNYDLALLEQLIKTECRYIGLLGPKKKLQRMLDELTSKGIEISDKQLTKIHGPAGLDIGAEGAEEIALSILSEIKAFFAERNGASLKFRQGTIYERTT